MEKTLKQIAEELKIDKQAAYRFVVKNHINEAHQKAKVKYYDDAAQLLIAQGFSKKTTSKTASKITSKITSSDAVIEVLLMQSELLQKELEIKNKQIEHLSVALAAAQQTAAAAQALHAGTIKQQLTLPEQTDRKPWQFWKKR